MDTGECIARCGLFCLMLSFFAIFCCLKIPIHQGIKSPYLGLPSHGKWFPVASVNICVAKKWGYVLITND